MKLVLDMEMRASNYMLNPYDSKDQQQSRGTLKIFYHKEKELNKGGRRCEGDSMQSKRNNTSIAFTTF